MRKLFFVIPILLIILLTNCSDNITQPQTKIRNLVVITDNEIGTELVVNILAGVNANFDDVQVDFIQTKAFDIAQGGFLLETAFDNYGDDTYFLAIVEPGTDSKRMALRIGNKRLLVPDNGLATRILNKYKIDEINYAENSSVIGGNKIEDTKYEVFYREATVSLLKNISISDFGTHVAAPVKIEINEPQKINDTFVGEILMTDNFGNCVTNITSEFLTDLKQGDLLKFTTSNNTFFVKYGLTYSSSPTNQNVAFCNGSKRLEVAVNYGDLSNRYSLAAGTKIEVVKTKVKVGILRYNQSELSNNIVALTKLSMFEQGFIEASNIEFIEKNANGDNNNFQNLITDLLNQNIDLIIPVSTPATQAAVKYIPESIPIVFTYVTSPNFSGILTKRGNITGVSDATNFDDYMSFVLELFPNMNTAGRIYNPTESNSAYSQTKFEELASLYNLTLYTKDVQSETDITNAYNYLKNNDFKTILIAADNTMNSGMAVLSTLASADKIAVIGDSKENTQDGALASIAIDYDLLSNSTGKLASAIILGEAASSKPIVYFNSTIVSINKKTANEIGYSFSQAIINKAKTIIE